jgi:hypothetical protein
MVFVVEIMPAVMRLLAWNIRAGGGARIEAITAALA